MMLLLDAFKDFEGLWYGLEAVFSRCDLSCSGNHEGPGHEAYEMKTDQTQRKP